VEHRIADRRVTRLIRKWLKAGVMEDGVVTPGTVGTPQGAVISPLLANIYLHYVFDLWANQWRKRHAHGDIIIVRGAYPCEGARGVSHLIPVAIREAVRDGSHGTVPYPA